MSEESATRLPELISPIDGQIIDTNDLNAIIEAYADFKRFDAKLYGYKQQLLALLTKNTNFADDTSTSYIRGNNIRLKLTKPKLSWNQSILKQLAAASPSLSKEFLRVGNYEVQMKRYDQLLRERGTTVFEDFKQALISANKGRIGNPSISVELLNQESGDHYDSGTDSIADSGDNSDNGDNGSTEA